MIEQLAAPYFYQVLDQHPPSGPLVLDKATLAPQVPIVVSAVSDTTQAGDTITLFFNGKQLGDPLPVKDPNELVYDLLIEPDAWSETTADVYVTVTRNAAVVARSQPLSLQVMSTPRVGNVQLHEGFLLGTYGPGVVDSWLVSGAYSIASVDQIPFSVLTTGQNGQEAVIELQRMTRSGEITSSTGVYLWKYENGAWHGGAFAPFDSNALQLARGDHLVMSFRAVQTLALEFVI
ncbi:hypothetical protein [Pseudomonas fluorescens]|uniref:Uncharacterized protein n=1 Tax=Pseudomonas fluorescens TaxID=294 RepID=A0A5E6Y2Z3_PSEFL|nr:hypothetical protein [Pseudomonas fluorescens]VVN46431.1 hypothetical protein PS655_05867 [Pseudomonas fluorescens]VVP61092.1 hypothetical protein PS870_06253 [Pseudomonas fluorescens]